MRMKIQNLRPYFKYRNLPLPIIWNFWALIYRKERGNTNLAHIRNLKKLKMKIKAILGRSRGISLGSCQTELTTTLRGWYNYFEIGLSKTRIQTLDKHTDGESGCCTGSDGRKSRQSMRPWWSWESTGIKPGSGPTHQRAIGRLHAVGYCLQR